MSKDRVVVVSYDAGSGVSTVNPNPVIIEPGGVLYFALQTLNKGQTFEAKFHEITFPNLGLGAEPVNGNGQLWSIAANETPPAEPETLSYSLAIEYHDMALATHDPSVVLLPSELPEDPKPWRE